MTMPPPHQPPHEPPASPYGAPQQWPAHPQPGTWGVPPAAPASRKRGPGEIIGIVAAAVVSLLALRVVALEVAGGDDNPAGASVPAPSRADGGDSRNDAGSSATRYRLTVPPSLLNGDYKLEHDISQTMDEGIAGQRSSSSQRNMKGVGGQYTNISGQGPQTLVASGLYGEITDPKRALESMFKGMNENPGVEVTTPAQDITPPAAAEPVTCEEYTFTRSGESGTASVCGWSDNSTVATVAASHTGDPLTLEELAKKTAKIRDQMRLPRQ